MPSLSRNQRRNQRRSRRRNERRIEREDANRTFSKQLSLPDLYHSRISQINWQDFENKPFAIFENGNIKKKGNSLKGIAPVFSDYLLKDTYNGRNVIERVSSAPGKKYTIGFRP